MKIVKLSIQDSLLFLSSVSSFLAIISIIQPAWILSIGLFKRKDKTFSKKLFVSFGGASDILLYNIPQLLTDLQKKL